MKLLLIYPKWNKLEGQTTFNLPPHGPVVMAAAIPEWVETTFIDENVEEVSFDTDCDFVAISMMLSTQVYTPAHMSAERLQELFHYAWDTFYKAESQEQKMFNLLSSVVVREMKDGTFRPRNRELVNKTFGKNITH